MDFWELASQHPCHLCRSFKPSRYLQLEGKPTLYSRHYKDHRDLRDVISSARRGCPGCRLLYDVLKAWNPTWTRDNEHTAKIWPVLFESVLTVSVRGFEFTGTWESDLMIFQAQEPKNYGRLTKPFYSTYDIIPDTTKPEAFDRARSWLRNCLDNHVCGSTANGAWMPSRVLDINTRELDQGDYVYLVQTPSEKAHYAALSYCWGEDLEGVTRTLRANKAAHMEGIPIDILPQTIRDAITASRALHIRFLWIDSLCIVQDDVEDWEREAETMSSVYQCAHVTICAHAATSCKDGFLGPQVYGQPGWQKAFWTSVESSPDGQTEFQFFLRAGQRHEFLTGTLHSALDRRGWALQESILSSRILHFTGNEMAWECDSAHFCECGHVGGFYSKNERPMTKTQYLDARRNLRRVNQVGAHDLGMGAWKTLVAQYSKRRLTYDRDKLVAIQGLADMCSGPERAEEQVESPTPHYIFGIFNAKLVDQLMWTVKNRGDDSDEEWGDDNQMDTSLDQKTTDLEEDSDSEGSSESDDRYPLGEKSRGNTSSWRPAARRLPLGIAPTWSWASIDGHIDYLPDFSQFGLQILADVIGSNEFDTSLELGGAVQTRDLIAQGIVVSVALKTVQARLSKWRRWKGDPTFVRAADGKAYLCLMDIEREAQIEVTNPEHSCWSQEPHPNEWLDEILENSDAAPRKKQHRRLKRSHGSADYGNEGHPASLPSGGFRMWSVDSSSSSDSSQYTCSSDSYGSDEEEERSESQGSENFERDSQGSLQSDANDVYDEAQLGRGLSMKSGSDHEVASDEPSEKSESDDSENSESAFCSWCELCGGDKPAGHESNYCCLRLAKIGPDPDSGDPEAALVFLVLRQSNQVSGAWERMGLGFAVCKYEQEGPESLFNGGNLEQLRLV